MIRENDKFNIRINEDEKCLYVDNFLKNTQKESFEYAINESENIDCLLQVKEFDNNGNGKVDIFNMISLQDLFNNNIKFNEQTLKSFVSFLKSSLTTLDNYLISENSLCLYSECVFVNKKDFEIYSKGGKTLSQNNLFKNAKILFIPNLNSDFKLNLSRLLIQTLRCIDVNDKNAVRLAYEMFLTSQNKDYKLNDLYELINSGANINEKYINLLAPRIMDLYDIYEMQDNGYTFEDLCLDLSDLKSTYNIYVDLYKMDFTHYNGDGWSGKEISTFALLKGYLLDFLYKSEERDIILESDDGFLKKEYENYVKIIENKKEYSINNLKGDNLPLNEKENKELSEEETKKVEQVKNKTLVRDEEEELEL